MKRRTRQHVGNWPNMRADTLKAITDELIRARKKHPGKAGNMSMLRTVESALYDEMLQFDTGRLNAVQIYARAAQVAAMAVRVLEEGAGAFKYQGNTQAPEFKLQGEDWL